MSVNLKQLKELSVLNHWSPVTKAASKNYDCYKLSVPGNAEITVGEVTSKIEYTILATFVDGKLHSVHLDSGIDLCQWGGLHDRFSKDKADKRGLVVTGFGSGRYHFNSGVVPGNTTALSLVIESAVTCADVLHWQIEAAYQVVDYDRCSREDLT